MTLEQKISLLKRTHELIHISKLLFFKQQQINKITLLYTKTNNDFLKILLKKQFLNLETNNYIDYNEINLQLQQQFLLNNKCFNCNFLIELPFNDYNYSPITQDTMFCQR